MTDARLPDSLGHDPRSQWIRIPRGDSLIGFIRFIGCVVPNETNESNESYGSWSPCAGAREAVVSHA